MRRLTPSEALEFLETTFKVGPGSIGSGLIEATGASIGADQCQRDLESWLFTLEGVGM